MENNLKFVKYHLPCPSCKSSDALSQNEDGSGKCFSCDEFFPSLDKQTTYQTKQVETNMQETIRELNAHGGVYAKLSDRNIAKETAEKYGCTFLGEIPLDKEIRTTSDAGRPIVVSKTSSPHAKAYMNIAAKIIDEIGQIMP